MSKKRKIAVILSGCGVYDGAEIHEATLSLYAIVKNGAEYGIFAPDMNQAHVINHRNGEVMKETRNVLTESARIARGKISPLSAFRADQYDGLLLPGGFGAAKNLSSYAFDGPAMKVNEEVANAIRSMNSLDRPVAALCISPVILASVLKGAEVTIGQDPGTAGHIEQLGARHTKSGHGGVVVDKKLKLVTSPCYMLDANIVQIAEGADSTVKALLKLMG